MQFNDYATLNRPSLEEPFPPFAYISKMNRLTILQSLQLADNFRPSQAVDLLENNIM